MGVGAEGMENAASTDGCGGGHRRVEAAASNIGSEVGGVVFADRDRGGSVGGTEAASGPREPSDDMVFT
jgi:hypothetical protein